MFRFEAMKTQPDTSTMEGRHAVERASGSCRLQFLHPAATEWSLCNDTPGTNRRFDWRRYSYRIHPEDLAKLPDPAARPADEWRMLEDGNEPLQEGDEAETLLSEAWGKILHELVGLPRKVIGSKVRRRVTKPDEWRMLEVGEIIQDGDEVYDDSRNEWVNVCESVGQPAPSPDYTPHRKFRRRVTKPETKPDEWRPWRIERIKNVLAKCREFKKNTRTAQSFDELELAVSMIVDYLNDLDGTPCGARKEEV